MRIPHGRIPGFSSFPAASCDGSLVITPFWHVRKPTRFCGWNGRQRERSTSRYLWRRSAAIGCHSRFGFRMPRWRKSGDFHWPGLLILLESKKTPATQFSETRRKTRPAGLQSWRKTSGTATFQLWTALSRTGISSWGTGMRGIDAIYQRNQRQDPLRHKSLALRTGDNQALSGCLGTWSPDDSVIANAQCKRMFQIGDRQMQTADFGSLMCQVYECASGGGEFHSHEIPLRKIRVRFEPSV